MNSSNKQKINEAVNLVGICANELIESFRKLGLAFRNNHIDFKKVSALQNNKPYYRMNDKY